MINITNEQKAKWIKKLIPLNGKGLIYAMTSPALVIPKSYRQYKSLGFRVDNQGEENEFFLNEKEISFAILADGNPEWVCIPLEFIYYVEGRGVPMMFDIDNLMPPEAVVSEDERVQVN